MCILEAVLRRTIKSTGEAIWRNPFISSLYSSRPKVHPIKVCLAYIFAFSRYRSVSTERYKSYGCLLSMNLLLPLKAILKVARVVRIRLRHEHSLYHEELGRVDRRYAEPDDV